MSLDELVLLRETYPDIPDRRLRRLRFWNWVYRMTHRFDTSWWCPYCKRRHPR